MLPIGERPLLEHIVRAVAESGIDDIVLVVGHKRERIQNHFGDGDEFGVSISYVRQHRPRGTGDALLQAEHAVDDSLLVLNGDRLVDASLLSELRETYESTGDACLAVTTVDNPSEYGVVTVTDGMVTDIVEKPPAHEIATNTVNVGVYVFGSEIFAAIRRTDTFGELGLTDTLANYLPDHPVCAVHYTGEWYELSNPWDLLAVNAGHLSTDTHHVADSAVVDDAATVSRPAIVGAQSFVHPGGRVLQNSVLGANVSVGANSVVQNSVLLDDVTIGPDTVVSDSIVGAGATIGQSASLLGGRSDIVLDGTLHEDVRFGALVGDRTDVGGSVTVTAGTIIGNGVTIRAGSVVRENVPDDADVIG
jgi:glucose-1-phosphate thymidylyltransferase